MRKRDMRKKKRTARHISFHPGIKTKITAIFLCLIMIFNYMPESVYTFQTHAEERQGDNGNGETDREYNGGEIAGNSGGDTSGEGNQGEISTGDTNDGQQGEGSTEEATTEEMTPEKMTEVSETSQNKRSIKKEQQV